MTAKVANIESISGINGIGISPLDLMRSINTSIASSWPLSRYRTHRRKGRMFCRDAIGYRHAQVFREEIHLTIVGVPGTRARHTLINMKFLRSRPNGDEFSGERIIQRRELIELVVASKSKAPCLKYPPDRPRRQGSSRRSRWHPGDGICHLHRVSVPSGRAAGGGGVDSSPMWSTIWRIAGVSVRKAMIRIGTPHAGTCVAY
jgi:hypothetical protein